MLAKTRWVVVCVLVAALAGCGAIHANEQQASKANELQQKLTSLGITVPTDVAASLYDDDGGFLCAAAAEGEAGLAKANVLAGSSFRGHLRTTVKKDSVAYARAVIEVYCPDELPAFESYASGFHIEEGD